MRSRPTRPSVGGMNSNHLLRIGAVAAVLGVIVQLAAAMLEPGRVGDADKAIRKISEMDAWTVRWLVHTTGILLIIAALSIVTRTFSAGPAKEWSRIGVPLIAIAGALGVAEVLVGASTKDLADGWAAAAPGANSAYFAAFEGAWNVDSEPRLRRDRRVEPVPADARGGDPVQLRLRALARLGVRGRRCARARRDRRSSCGRPSGPPSTPWEACSSSSC